VGASDATSGLSVGAENDTPATLPKLPPQPDLFPTYYGVSPAQEITLQVYSGVSPIEQYLPASILDVGTWQIADQPRSYAVSLVEAAGYWKSHPRHAVRAYGNADIDRLHGN
jgi:hypothetical protein